MFILNINYPNHLIFEIIMPMTTSCSFKMQSLKHYPVFKQFYKKIYVQFSLD